MTDYFTPIAHLGFSTRIGNCLANDGIKTLGELTRRREAELLRIPEFGRKSFKELKERLSELGWELARCGGKIQHSTPLPAKPDNMARIADALEAIAAVLTEQVSTTAPWPDTQGDE